MPTLLSDGILLVFIPEDWQIDFHMTPWLPAASAMVHMPGPPDLLDHEDTDKEVDTELLSFSILWSGEGEGVRVGAAHRSCHICLWSWPHCGTRSWSRHDIQWVCLGSSTHLLVLCSLSSYESPSWLQNLNGSNAGRCEWGCPGPLASTCHLVMAWAINHQPSHRLNALVLSLACLPTQLMAPDRVNMVSCASHKQSPSPRDCLP